MTDSADDAQRSRPARGDSQPARRGADLARDALEAARARRAGVTGSGPAAGAAAGPGSAVGGGAGSAGGGADGRSAAGARRSGSGRSGNRGSHTAMRLRRRRWSGPGADKARDPQRLGDVVDGWLAATGAGREVTRATLFERWAEIVGPEIADHAEPVSLVDGELVVQAESTAWATQLRMLAAGMIRRINGEIGKSAVVRIKTKGPAGPSWRFGNRHVSGRGPRDTYG